MDPAQPTLDGPAPERPGADGPARPAWPQRAWRRSAGLGKEAISLAGGLVAILSFVLVIAIVVESMVERTVTIRPLSVPKALSEDGISSEVIALGLRDAMNVLVDEVHRERGWQTTEVMDPEELPDVAVPSVGLSAQALAADVRAFFKIQNRTVISGEVVWRADGYALTLRLNGRPFFRSARGEPRDRIGDMVEVGARAALQMTQPTAAAAIALDDGDKQKALAICDGVIGRAKDLQDERARTLKARALALLGHVEEAIAETRTIFRMYPKDPAPHNNLGLWLKGLDRRDAAIAEFRAAVALDPGYALAHSNLGRMLLSMDRSDEGMQQLETGIALAPKLFAPHFVMAMSLRAAGRFDEALSQYRIAAALTPDHPEPHRMLGVAFRDLGRRGEAVAQFEAALALAPKDAGLHRVLADTLRELGRPADAAAEYRIAVALDPAAVAAHHGFALVLDDLGRSEEAAAERAAAERDVAGAVERAAAVRTALLLPGPSGAESETTSAMRESTP